MRHIISPPTLVTKSCRSKQKQQRPCLLWFTGLSGAGKSTIAGLVEHYLIKAGKHTYLLDGDNVRQGLCKDLNFSDVDREENIRRIGEVSKLFVDAGIIVLSAFISPFASDRALVRALFSDVEFIEIFVDTPLEECEKRDPKGLYKKARGGEIQLFTGIDSAYEAPSAPEVHLHFDGQPPGEMAQEIIRFLNDNNYLTMNNEQ